MTCSSYNCIASHKSIAKTKKERFDKMDNASCPWPSCHDKLI